MKLLVGPDAAGGSVLEGHRLAIFRRSIGGEQHGIVGGGEFHGAAIGSPNREQVAGSVEEVPGIVRVVAGQYQDPSIRK
jgi:hypothetical protein